MDLESRFKELGDFLRSHSEFINEEPLNFSPQGIPSPYGEWAKKLRGLGDDALISLETKLVSPINDQEFSGHLDSVKRLGSLPQIEKKFSSIGKNIERGMTEKKRHEVSLIAGELRELGAKKFLDVGSGKGHLSMALLQEHKGSSLCVDMDAKLQKAGREKLKKLAPELSEKIVYINERFDRDFPYKEQELALALHSCGDLSVDAIENALTHGCGLLNFGCCYHKLSKTGLSSLAKSFPLKFSFQALNLAARSNRKLEQEDLKRRNKVKRFRYAFHILSQEDGHKDFVTLGNAKHTDYDGEFKAYCEKYSPWKLSGDLNKRFENLLDSGVLDEYLLAEAIRGPLGRLVEIYIVLDRALYIKERGKRVAIGELFDPALSPRNIMLFFKG